MDPNETLRKLRELGSDIGEYAPGDLDGVAYELVDLFSALDTWLTKGGCLPAAWSWPVTTFRKIADELDQPKGRY